MIQQWWRIAGRGIAGRVIVWSALGVIALASVGWAAHHEEGEAAAVRKFTVVNVLYEGAKMFVPSVLIAEKGETVQIKIINKIPGDPPTTALPSQPLASKKWSTAERPRRLSSALTRLACLM